MIANSSVDCSRLPFFQIDTEISLHEYCLRCREDEGYKQERGIYISTIRRPIGLVCTSIFMVHLIDFKQSNCPTYCPINHVFGLIWYFDCVSCSAEITTRCGIQVVCTRCLELRSLTQCYREATMYFPKIMVSDYIEVSIVTRGVCW